MDGYYIDAKRIAGVDNNYCSSDDFACLSMASIDKMGLEAIKSLHQKLDDDANGNVDLSESNDVSFFLLKMWRGVHYGKPYVLSISKILLVVDFSYHTEGSLIKQPGCTSLFL